MGIGVVYDYKTDQMPGFWKSTVGYHIDDRQIFDYEFEQKKKFKKTYFNRFMCLHPNLPMKQKYHVDSLIAITF